MVEHKTKVYKGFTEKYGIDCLVWYTVGSDIKAAIELEKNKESWKAMENQSY